MNVVSLGVSRLIPPRDWPGNNAVDAALVLIAYSMQKKGLGRTGDIYHVSDVKIF